MSSPLKILERRAAENVYLHRDFHGALCYAIRYLDETFGPEATEAYLRQVGETCYASLTAALKSEGLSALERHFRAIFELEGGKFDIEVTENAMTLTVTSCPAIAHLKRTGQFFTDRFCIATVVVNQTICRAAGIEATCAYEPGLGRCVQRFRRKET